jgi:DNA polymerase III epsilon subunit-like protein
LKEGPTYESQYELNTNTSNTENTYQIPHPMTISGSESWVFFDLETTGLGKNCEITQIATKVDEGVFQKYVIPRVDIQLEASKVTGIAYSHSTNIVYVHGENVEAISIQKALLDFLEFVLNTCNLLKEL